MKFGSSPSCFIKNASMPAVVDFPLVPATATVLNADTISARYSGRVFIGTPKAPCLDNLRLIVLYRGAEDGGIK